METVFGFRSGAKEETKEFGDGLKAGTDGEQLAFAQTISPSAPTPSTELQVSLSALRKPPSTLSTFAEIFSKWGPVFCFIDWESHRIINCENKGGQRKPYYVRPSSRAVS